MAIVMLITISKAITKTVVVVMVIWLKALKGASLGLEK